MCKKTLFISSVCLVGRVYFHLIRSLARAIICSLLLCLFSFLFLLIMLKMQSIYEQIWHLINVELDILWLQIARVRDHMNCQRRRTMEHDEMYLYSMHSMWMWIFAHNKFASSLPSFSSSLSFSFLTEVIVVTVAGSSDNEIIYWIDKHFFIKRPLLTCNI